MSKTANGNGKKKNGNGNGNGHKPEVHLTVASARDCYLLCVAETTHYQSLANLHGLAYHEREQLIAKRDACSKIARMIRFGPAAIDVERKQFGKGRK